MPLPPTVLTSLHSGWIVAAELTPADAKHRAYVMVIPQVLESPKRDQRSEVWQDVDRALPNPLWVLRDPAFITGYEIRYIAHAAEYTNTKYGWDADIVLDDKTTRLCRVFVAHDDEIEEALSP